MDIQTLIIPFNCAVVAVVWVFAITEDIFDFVPKVVNSFLDKFVQNDYWADKIRAITYACEKCIAGQLALWIGLFSNQYSIYDLHSILQFVLSIFYSIFIAMLIAKFLNH